MWGKKDVDFQLYDYFLLVLSCDKHNWQCCLSRRFFLLNENGFMQFKQFTINHLLCAGSYCQTHTRTFSLLSICNAKMNLIKLNLFACIRFYFTFFLQSISSIIRKKIQFKHRSSKQEATITMAKPYILMREIRIRMKIERKAIRNLNPNRMKKKWINRRFVCRKLFLTKREREAEERKKKENFDKSCS